MPNIGGCRWVAFLVVVDDQLRAVCSVGGKRVNTQITEVATKALQVLRGDDLVRENQNSKFGMGTLQVCNFQLAQRLAQVNASDLGAQEHALFLEISF